MSSVKLTIQQQKLPEVDLTTESIITLFEMKFSSIIFSDVKFLFPFTDVGCYASHFICVIKFVNKSRA